MKKIVSAIALFAVTVCAAAKPGHVPAQKSAETSLALFVDAATWEHCSEAISSYRDTSSARRGWASISTMRTGSLPSRSRR